MKVLFISKYPPIEGHVSSAAYWLARGLAGRGHRIAVVTNAFEVEDAHRERLSGEDLDRYQGEGVRVRNTDPFQELFLIPRGNPAAEKLASAALDESGGADLIDSWYLVSFGAAGLMVKALTGLPLVLRHAGSDLGRLGGNPHLGPLIRALLGKADAVVTRPGASRRLREMGAPAGKVRELPISVDTSAFNPRARPADLGLPEGVPVISCIGKVSRGKGLPDLFRALSLVRRDFRLLLLTSGAEALAEIPLPPRLRRRTVVRPFVPPWRVPGVIRASRCVVMPEHDFPIRGHLPMLPREVLACGTCLVLSEELRSKVAGGALRDGENVLSADPRDAGALALVLERVLRDDALAENIAREGLGFSRTIEDFPGWILQNERLYKELLR